MGFFSFCHSKKYWAHDDLLLFETYTHLLKHLIKTLKVCGILVKVLTWSIVLEYLVEVEVLLAVAMWRLLSCPQAMDKNSLLAKHAQTALLLSPSIPPRSTSLTLWKRIVNFSHLTPLSLPRFLFPSPHLFTSTIFFFFPLSSPDLLVITHFIHSASFLHHWYSFILFSSPLSHSFHIILLGWRH